MRPRAEGRWLCETSTPQTAADYEVGSKFRASALTLGQA